MQNFQKLENLKEELMTDPEFAKEYKENKQYYELAKIIVGIRLQTDLTQKEFAKKIGTTQSRISAWENGNTKGMKIETLKRIIEATNNKLVLSVQKNEKPILDNDSDLAVAF